MRAGEPTPAPIAEAGTRARIGEALLAHAVGARHGVAHDVQLLATARCDVDGVWHAGVAERPDAAGRPVGPPAGGVGWTPQAARDAAVGEAVERYAAAVCPLPATDTGAPALPVEAWSLFSDAQRSSAGFPYGAAYDRGALTRAWSLSDNSPWLVPRPLVGLSDPTGHGFATSSGLAAAPSRPHAALRATQEVVERDALMTTWNHGVAGRRVRLGEPYEALVGRLGGEVVAIDATPGYSPHPVALVCGWVPRRGRRRIALGAACRATWAEAADKAFLEFTQGVLFAGLWCAARPGLAYRRPSDVVTFEDHAAYYTAHPDRWDQVPLLGGAGAPGPPPMDGPATLEGLVGALGAAGVRLFYRDLTGPDVAQLGLAVVRVLSPDLTPIHCAHDWPFLGGRAADLAWRYPWASPATRRWPSPFPHPLG
ncbi:MAG: YcaO-like family protein [Acidimicrobiales bacterium]